MGTNFYWHVNPRSLDTKHGHSDSIHIHIGKRSAAGHYCWDCGTTLHTGGDREVHYSHSDNGWQDRCPSCGKSAGENANIAVNQELGFAKATDKHRHGVSSCSSFSWTLLRHERDLEELAQTHPTLQVLSDEYGKLFTAREFFEELKFCPIRYQCPYEFS